MKTEDKGETMLPAAEACFYIDVPFGSREMGDTGAHSVAGGTSLQVELVHLNERGREAEMNKRIGLRTFQFHASYLVLDLLHVLSHPAAAAEGSPGREAVARRGGRGGSVRLGRHKLLQHAGNVPFQALLLLLFKEVAFLVPGELGLRLCC